MIKYQVLQRNVEHPLNREGSALMVFDKEGNGYRITISPRGEVQIGTMDGELHVIPQCSNMINLKVERNE